MPSTQLQQIVRRIVSLAESDRQQRTDADLLDAFRTSQDQAAFAQIIQRHGGLVMSVCQRVLGNQAAIDDAWQATFLILARRAGSIRIHQSLASWLHGVAHRTALNERRAALRRTKRETAAEPPTIPTPDRQAAFREIQEIVDAQVQRLPSHLREVFIRCALENECRADVAACLGLNEGTVRSRLSTARRLMRDRLSKKGIELSVALAVAAATTTQVSAALSESTVCAAANIVSGGLKQAIVSSHVAALVAGAARGFYAGKLAAVFVVLAIGAIGLGLGIAQPDLKDPAPKKDAPPTPVADSKEVILEADPLPPGALARLGTTRFRTGEMVTGLLFSPSGKQIASLCSDNDDLFALWDAHNGKERWRVRTVRNTMLALAWPKEDKGFAVMESGELWDFTAEKRMKLPEPELQHKGPRVAPKVRYDAATVSADGTLLAAATGEAVEGAGQTIAIYEMGNAKSIADLKVLTKCELPKMDCDKLAFTPDRKRLIGLCSILKDDKPTGGGRIVCWGKDGKIEWAIDVPDGVREDDFHFSVSNSSIALGLGDGDTLVVDLENGKTQTLATQHKAKGDGAGVFAVAFSPDEKTLATTGSDGFVRLTDMATGKVTRELGPHRSWPQALAFTADGSRLISGGQDALIRVWDTATGKEAVPTGGHAYRVWRVSTSADGRTIATEGGDHKLHIWDGTTGVERRQIDTGGNVNFSQLTPDGKQVIAVVGDYNDPDKILKVWEVATGTDATPRGFPKAFPCRGFRFTPDGKTLLTHHDDKLAAWTWPDGKQLWTANMPKPGNVGINTVSTIGVSPDGLQFITVAARHWYRLEKGLRYGYAADGIIDLWDTTTGKRIRRLVESEGGAFRDAVYGADGMVIHSGGGFLPTAGPNGKSEQLPNSICIIDPLTGRLVRSFSGMRNKAGYAVGLSADGKVLFRATREGGVDVFEVATGGFRRSYSGHMNEVLSFFAPAADVRRAITGSMDTTALLWDMGYGGKKPSPIAEADRAKLWAELADADAEKADAVMSRLAGDPAAVVALVREHLKPAPAGPTAADLAPILRDLDSPRFAVREAASTQIDRFGEGAIPLVRAELEKSPSAEVRERLIKYLNRHDGSREDRLVQIRAVELLEHLGTPDASEVLKKLAGGGSSRLTTDAASALKRLAIRK